MYTLSDSIRAAAGPYESNDEAALYMVGGRLAGARWGAGEGVRASWSALLLDRDEGSADASHEEAAEEGRAPGSRSCRERY